MINRDIMSYKAASMNSELILACGGSSQRMGQNKLLMNIGGKPCILRTCEAFAKSPHIKRIIIAAPLELHEVYAKAVSDINIPITFVVSGETRRQSVMNAVSVATEDIIVIHDGARPLISADIIEKSIEDAYNHGSSVVCTPAKDTIRYDDGVDSYSPDRSKLFYVQTPQSFSRKLYLAASEAAEGDYTDDAQLLDVFGVKPHITQGSYSNIKLTTPEDIAMAEVLMGVFPRIGHGYDVHRLVEGRALILGGVKIPYEKGLLGHSDADVLTHALMDALLGAAALGDIGKLFPDNDPEYEGADSIDLLKEVVRVLGEKGFRIINADVTVVAQSPKLSPYISKMRITLAEAMGISESCVSVKATTEERLGFTGSGDGIAAHAVAMIYG